MASGRELGPISPTIFSTRSLMSRGARARSTRSWSQIVGMGREEIRRREALGERLTYLAPMRVSGWRAIEDFVCWTGSRRATLSVPTRLSPFTPVMLYLMLQAPDGTGPENISVVAEAGGEPTRLTDIRA